MGAAIAPTDVDNFNPALTLSSGTGGTTGAAHAPLLQSQLYATPGYMVANHNNGPSSGASSDFDGPFGLGYAPFQLQTAYGFNQLNFLGGNYDNAGKGQTIAIVDAFDDPNITTDLQTFDTTFGIGGISGNPSDTSFFTKVSETGGSTAGITPDGGWSVEISLDVEWAHAMAPGAKILLVETNDNSYVNLFTGAAYAASVPGVSVVSMSFGGGEAPSFDSVFTTPAGHLDGNGNPGGVTFIASTGDNGAPGGYPSLSPNVLAVGGTSMQLDPSNAIVGETGWGGSGGGISQFEASPTYQAGIQANLTANGTPSDGFRTIPDVAYDADPNTGMAIQDTFENPYFNINGWTQIGGTSDAAPQWASLIAIADQYRVSHGQATLDGATETLPMLYQFYQNDPGAFNDISSGYNGYFATPGYDLVTGMGTPVVPNLVHDFSPDMTVVSTNPAAGSFVAASPTSVTIQFSDPFDPASVNLADFQLDGASPNASTSSGANSLTLVFNPSPATHQGPQAFAVLQGAVNRLGDGSPIDAFNETFYYAATQLQEISTNPSDGSLFNFPGDLIVHFNAAVDPGSINTGNLVLSAGTVTAASAVVGDPTSVDYQIVEPGSADGAALTVAMANGALLDAFGNPGLGFTATFTANVLISPYPTPLTPVAPLGSLVYDPAVSGSIGFIGDSASFTIALNPGQTVSISVMTDGNLQGIVGISDSHGNLIANAGASAPGQELLLQTVPIAAAGTYTITVRGDNDTTGAFTAQLVLNAALEAENNGGPASSNDSIAGAQDLTGAFTALGNGGSRAAVLGNVAGGVASGDVWVSERPDYNGTFGGAIALYDNNGNLIKTLTSSAFNVGVISGVQIGPDNTIYVGVDSAVGTGNGGELVHLDTSGNLLGIVHLPNDPASGGFFYYYPFGFKVASDGTFWVPQPNTGFVIHTDSSGALLQSYFVGGNPEDVAVRADGQVFIANGSLLEVQQLDPATGAVSIFGDFGNYDPLGVSFAGPGGTGDLLVANYYYYVFYYNSAGGLDQFDYVGSSNKAEADLNGNLFSTAFGNQNLSKLDLFGNNLFNETLNGPSTSLAVVGVNGPLPPPIDSSDYYAVTIAEGQSATIALSQLQGSGAALDLENSAGTVLALAHPGTNGTDLAINDFVAPAAGTYYIHVAGSGVKYNVVVTKNSDFGTGPNQSPSQPQSIAGEAGVLGSINGAPAYYSINARSGDKLTLSTTTPGNGSGQFPNAFNPKLVLLNPSGAVVASAENNAADGINALLHYQAQQTGTYTIEVLPSDATAAPTSGEFVLAVSGATGKAAAFTVTGTNPAANSIVAALPTITVDFGAAVYLPSLTAGALTVDGAVATAVAAVNDREAVFTLPPLVGSGYAVKHAIKINSTIKNLQGVSLSSFSENITVDNLPPQVVKSSIVEGQQLRSGNFNYKATFNDKMNVAALSAASFDLHGEYLGVDYQPTSFSFDGSGKVLTIQFANLPDDVYTLTLFSQAASDGGPATNASGFENQVNTPLDGETQTPFSLPSGDGIAGGNFAVDFEVYNAKAAFPTPLTGVAPAGSLVYQGSTSDVITGVSAPDTLTLKLDAGQTVTLDLAPDANLQAQISFNGQTVTAAGAGSEVVLETVPAAAAGTYSIQVAGVNGTLGLYQLTVTLNAAVSNPSAPNPTMAAAQDLTAGFIAEGKGSRAAALGQVIGSTSYYSFTAAAGQSISLGVSSNAGNASLELLDAGGNLLGLSAAGAGNYDQTLSNFTARYSGAYFVAVSGASGATFNLVVTRGLEVDPIVWTEIEPSLATPVQVVLTRTT